tara:strand:+ start:339 stop:1124 length:786 start_codon:yes stop_codon:yes gene_type:complete
MNHSFKIYGLKDPITQELRYVGQTTQKTTRHRFNGHVNEKKNNKKNQWIRSLKSKNTLPVIFIIDECYSLDELNYLEIFWIGYFKSIGCRLTNVTTGGDGVPGTKQSPETIAKRMINQIGSKRSEETKIKLSEAARNRGESFKKKMSDIAKNRPKEYYDKFKDSSLKASKVRSEEEKKILSDKRKATLLKNGYKVTDETKKKLSKASKGRIVTEETREKIRNTIKGQKYPIERVLKSELGRKKAREAKLKLLKLDLFNEKP